MFTGFLQVLALIGLIFTGLLVAGVALIILGQLLVRFGDWVDSL